MNNFNEKDFIDADYYTEVDTKDEKKNNEQKIIRGEPLFYTTTQVAEMVGVEPSTIRFWTKRFEDLLDVEISNKNKQYKKTDIEKLVYIKKLAREDGMTLQQVEDYCSSKGFDINEIKQSVIDSTNPLAIQAFISAVSIEIDKKFDSFTKDLLNKIGDQQKISLSIQQDSNDKLQEQIAYTVDSIISEKLQSLSSNVENSIENQLQMQMDEQERRFIERDIKNIELIKQHMDERKKESEIEKEKKRSFWKTWFKK